MIYSTLTRGLLFGDFSNWDPRIFKKYTRDFGRIQHFGIEYECTMDDLLHLSDEEWLEFYNNGKNKVGYEFSRNMNSFEPYADIVYYKPKLRKFPNNSYLYKLCKIPFSSYLCKDKQNRYVMTNVVAQEFIEITKLFEVNNPMIAYKQMEELFTMFNKYNIRKFGSWHGNFQCYFNKNLPISHKRRFIGSMYSGGGYIIGNQFTSSAYIHYIDQPMRQRDDVYRIEIKEFPNVFSAGQLLLAAYVISSHDEEYAAYLEKNMVKWGLLFSPIKLAKLTPK